MAREGDSEMRLLGSLTKGCWIILVGLAVSVGAACQPGMGPVGVPGCDDLAAGDFECMIGTRMYLLHVPANLASPAPFVIDSHGLGSTAAGQRRLSGWLQLSDQQGFVVAHPQGVGNSFNGTGGCCTFNNAMDDVGFFRLIVGRALVAGAGRIDPQRVIATGFSNGGAISHRIACEAADMFAAIAPVAFSLGTPTIMATPPPADVVAAGCKPSKPITMMQTHGTADTVADFNLGVLGALPAPASLEAWTMVNRCSSATGAMFSVPPNVNCELRSAACAGGSQVSLCRVEGSQHNAFTPVLQQTGMSIPQIIYPRLLTAIQSQLNAGNSR